MDIILVLTIRHLKQNKKRTVSAVTGIMTASALLTMAAVFMNSFLEQLQNMDIAAEELQPLLSGAAVVMAVILAVMVIFLYNMLSISYRDRVRYLGMLGSVGATPFQRGKTALLEALIIGSIGIPAGLIVGTFLSFAIFSFQIVISWRMFLIIFLCEWITVIITGLIHTWLSQRGSAIELMQNRTDKRVFKGPVKIPGWIGSFLGIESQFAVKNIVFFRKRYIVVGISFIISMILFLDGYIFINYLDGYYAVHDLRPKEQADLVIAEEYGKRTEAWNDFIAEIKELPELETYTIKESVQLGGVLLDQKNIRKDAKSFTAYSLGGKYKNPVMIYDCNDNEKKGYCMDVVLTGMNDEAFQHYLELAGLSDSNNSSDGAVPVLIEDFPLADIGGNLSYRSILNIKDDSILSLYSDTGHNMIGMSPQANPISQFEEIEFKVLGTTDIPPINYDVWGRMMNDPNTLYIYTSQSMFDKFLKESLSTASDLQVTRAVQVRIKSTEADLPENILYPVVTHLGNTYTYRLKIGPSSLSMLTNTEMQDRLKSRSKEAAEVQKKIVSIGRKYGLSDGSDKDILSDNFYSELDYTINSYQTHVEAALADPVPLLRHLFVYGLLIFITIISIFQMLKMISSAAQMRRREFAVFMSLGMRRSQIEKMVFIENLICNAAAFAIGLMSSTLIAGLMFKNWKMEQAVEIVFPYRLILLEAVFFAFLILLSLYISIKSVQKIRIIDVIKDDTV